MARRFWSPCCCWTRSPRKRLWAWSCSWAALGGVQGRGLLGAAEVGDQCGVEPVGLVAAEGGPGVARHGQGLEHADGVAGVVGVPGDGEAVGADGLEAEVERAGGAGPGQQPGGAGRGVGHGEGAGRGQEQAGVELVFGYVEAQYGFGGTHEVMLLRTRLGMNDK